MRDELARHCNESSKFAEEATILVKYLIGKVLKMELNLLDE